ncbi:TRAP transporter small permease [Desulfobacula sp.]|uniref:TRAP transporter small permease n=1 Tax=Desulfobacula sp. TaxID=2593537 RepID=UPI0026107700|nr:TRAP transporter small permease [Desulfobacula sp.]
MRKGMQTLVQIEETILCLIILQMGLSVFFQVIMRYVFHSAITWLDELVHYEVILITFFGASLGIKYGSHICVGVVKDFVKKPLFNLLEAANHIIIAVYSGFIIYFGMNLVMLMTKHPHFTPTLRIPKHYLYVMVCLGMGLICIRSLIKSFNHMAAFLNDKHREVSS